MATKELIKPFRANTLFDEFLKPFDSFFDMPATRLWNKVFTTPLVNIKEYENEFRIELAVPGMKKDDFKIDIESNMLTVSAETEEKKEDILEGYTRNEYNYTSFSRSFTIPEGIDTEVIMAKYVDGVLKLTLPKKEEFKKYSMQKHITVQ